MTQTNMRTNLRVLLPLLLMMSVSQSALAQVRFTAPEVRRTTSGLRPPLTVFGVVYDLSDGSLLSGTMITIPGSDVRVMADRFGRFELHVPRPGVYMLEVGVLGFGLNEVLIGVDSLQALALEIGLETRPVPICGTMLCSGPLGCDHVVVRVRDIVTGRSPTVPVTLRVRGRDRVDSSMTASSVRGRVELGLPVPAGPLPVTAQVEAEGYQPWQSQEIWGACGHIGARELFVWLIPSEEGLAPRPQGGVMKASSPI